MQAITEHFGVSPMSVSRAGKQQESRLFRDTDRADGRSKAIGGKEGKGSRRIFVRLQGAAAGA
jgi:hypothetical protein